MNTKKYKDIAIEYKRDAAAVAALVIFAFLMFFFLKGSRTGGYVKVTIDGRLQGRYPITEDARIEIKGDNDEAAGNILVIASGEAYMESATCPDGLCVKTGHIGRDGQSIICLPHKVVVSVEADGDNNEYDVIVGK